MGHCPRFRSNAPLKTCPAAPGVQLRSACPATAAHATTLHMLSVPRPCPPALSRMPQSLIPTAPPGMQCPQDLLCEAAKARASGRLGSATGKRSADDADLDEDDATKTNGNGAKPAKKGAK